MNKLKITTPIDINKLIVYFFIPIFIPGDYKLCKLRDFELLLS